MIVQNSQNLFISPEALSLWRTTQIRAITKAALMLPLPAVTLPQWKLCIISLPIFLPPCLPYLPLSLSLPFPSLLLPLISSLPFFLSLFSMVFMRMSGVVQPEADQPQTLISQHLESGIKALADPVSGEDLIMPNPLPTVYCVHME